VKSSGCSRCDSPPTGHPLGDIGLEPDPRLFAVSRYIDSGGALLFQHMTDTPVHLRDHFLPVIRLTPLFRDEHRCQFFSTGHTARMRRQDSVGAQYHFFLHLPAPSSLSAFAFGRINSARTGHFL
jgi:hypothetical protein